MWISALQMPGKNRNRLELPLGLWKNSVCKTSWASLPAKQAITVGSSSGFNVKLLHDWSIFDLPKRMPEEHVCLMPASCLSLINTCRIKANQLFITAQPIRNLRTPASADRNEQKGFLIAGVPYPLSPIPLPFSLPPYLLSTPATHAIRKISVDQSKQLWHHRSQKRVSTPKTECSVLTIEWFYFTREIGSRILRAIMHHSGTPLIRSPMGQKYLAVLMGWPY